MEIPGSADCVARHTACYERRISEFANLLSNFDESGVDYVKKIQSALADDKKPVQAKAKKTFGEFIKGLFAKKEEVNPFAAEMEAAQEKLSALRECLDGSHKIILGVRPEKVRIKLVREEAAKAGGIIVKATVCELLGAEYNVHFNLFGKDVVSSIGVEQEIAEGDLFKVELNEEDLYAFDPITGDVI